MLLPHSLSHTLGRTTSLAQSTFLAAVPHGGQGTARRNAWASMSSDAVRARGRRDAEQAMLLAEHLAAGQSASRAQ